MCSVVFETADLPFTDVICGEGDFGTLTGIPHDHEPVPTMLLVS